MTVGKVTRRAFFDGGVDGGCVDVSSLLRSLVLGVFILCVLIWVFCVGSLCGFASWTVLFSPSLAQLGTFRVAITTTNLARASTLSQIHAHNTCIGHTSVAHHIEDDDSRGRCSAQHCRVVGSHPRQRGHQDFASQQARVQDLARNHRRLEDSERGPVLATHGCAAWYVAQLILWLTSTDDCISRHQTHPQPFGHGTHISSQVRAHRTLCHG